MINRKIFFAATVAASALALTAPAAAQVQGGSQGSVDGRDISVGTSGYGSTDGRSIEVGGTADAEARNGGEVDTQTRARTNDRAAMQRSVARARDEDERARSTTRTRVRQGEVVRSRTSTMYRERGQPPVREIIRTTTTSEGTTTNRNGSSRPDPD